MKNEVHAAIDKRPDSAFQHHQSMTSPIVFYEKPSDCRGIILHIEDEMQVARLVSLTLNRNNLHVITADDGLEGIDIYKEMGDEIDLVLLDIQLPGMKGDEVFRRIRKINPASRFLVASGYTEDNIVDMFNQQHIEGFLQKPFTPSMLLDAINSVMG